MKDRIFTKDIGKQFEFDTQVASVFDDMLERSIPHYKEVLGLIVDFCAMNLKTENALIYDLGSSTGTTLLALYQALPSSTHFIGIDNSQAMIDKATLKAKAYGANITFLCEDVFSYQFSPSHIIIANYILQFIRPIQRQALLQKIYDSLADDGVLMISEKMSSPHRILDKQMIERYMRYKMEQGYTQSEISKKREALENVLIPFSLAENITMLKNVGFSGVEVLFKWVNFGTLIAKK
ncbi:carboxy-S-adenosyl-L-methionine synthase CmoA [uncultured Helicobacter sp.]|uniref:carboxy-S-adenosyl-L-methionine synthase CmoA n=1 Tax=uncultured Helicobacter sp. TaxID=175537 RepID=UPI0026143B94|nr:carboxy-S-adenosyl-L-methionine synthase CmoA [uncultured Helicobacter sp.]